MIIVMETNASDAQIEAVIQRLMEVGLDAYRSRETHHTLICGVGDRSDFHLADFDLMPGVKEAYRVSPPYKLARRAARPQGTVVQIGEVEIGGDRLEMIARAPDASSEDEIQQVAQAIVHVGGRMIHSGACSPHLSPHTSQRSQQERFEWIRHAADQNHLLVLAEVSDSKSIPMLAEFADVFHVDARNMENYALLEELGRQPRSVLLDRSLSATFEELLIAAEHILLNGNDRVVLCERGIRSFDHAVDTTMDLSAIPAIKKLSHLPIIADPSRATGRRDMVAPMARAAVAAGADGLMIDVHHNPATLTHHSSRTISIDDFYSLMEQLRLLASAIGRRF